MYVSAVIAGYIMIIFMELIPLWKDKKTKEIIVYLGIMMVSLIISICLVSGVELPAISNVIRKVLFIK